MDNFTANKKQGILRSSLLLKLFTILIFSFVSPQAFAQLDLIHYVPPLYVGTTSYLDIEDHWVVLTTPSETPIEVTIKRGDGTVFKKVANVSISTPQTVSLNEGQKGTIANPPLGVVNYTSLNKPITDQGLIFTSTEAFYVNIRHKSEIHGLSLTAKGQAALGTSFRSGHVYSIRGENMNGWGGGYYSRHWPYSWKSYSTSVVDHRSHFISVMATEDNTLVTFSNIKVANLTSDTKTALPVTGPITVSLDAGESYVLGADLKFLTEDEANSLNGTKISSDKPIAVNSGSWCGGRALYSSQDIGVDQIVPEKSVGREYILLEGKGNNETERPIVVATQDNTDIFVNGSTSKIRTLAKAGDSYAIPSSHFINDVMLIKTSEDAYLYQTTSASSASTSLQYATVGMNFIPPLSALGFRQVDIPFVTELGETGIVAIYAQKGSNVYVNNSDTPLDSPLSVTGNEEWVVYKYAVERAYEGEVVNVSVKSDKAIYVALSVEDDAVGAAGYFSGFTKSISPIDTAVVFNYDLGYICSNKNKNLNLAINSTPIPDWYEWYEAKEPTDVLLYENQDLLIDVSDVADKYILKAYFRDPNMDILYNGDFAINWGSSYSSLDFSKPLNLEVLGKVTLTSNPKTINTKFTSFIDLDGVGKMLLAHSSGKGLADTIWQQTINNSTDIPGNLFVLKVYGRLAEEGTDQSLDIYVNDDKVFTNFRLNDVSKWKSVKAYWKAGSAESAEIRIVDANASGDDAVFALDSISFVPAIEATKEYNPDVVPSYSYDSHDGAFHLCEGVAEGIVDISYSNDMEWFTFSWEKQNEDLTFSPITDTSIKGLDTYKLIFNNVIDDYAGTYRCTIGFKETYGQCGIDAAPIQVEVEVFVDEPATMDPLSGETELCQGISTDISTVISGGFSVVTWSVFRDGETTAFESSEGSQSTFTFNRDKNYEVGKYTVQCEVVNGCTDDLLEKLDVEIFGRPNLTDLQVPTGLCVNKTENLTALSSIPTGATMEYSWYQNDVLIKTNNLSVYPIVPVLTDTYYKVGVAARYDTGSADDLVCIGNDKTVTLNPGDIYPEVVLASLPNIALCEGKSYLYEAKLATTGDNYEYTYLWETPTDVVGDKTKVDLSLTGITSGMAGNYKITAINRCGSDNSTGVLTVLPKVEITGYKLSKDGPYCLNEDVTITINDNGYATSYIAENLRTNETINLASNSFTIRVTASTEGQWEVTAQNSCGDVSIVIPINLVDGFSAPTIADRAACVGELVKLNTVVKTPPAGLTYQWYKGTVLLSEKTSTELVFSSVKIADAGEYTCVVSDGICSSQEAKGILSVDDITSELNPGSEDVCEGKSHHFEVTYVGNPTFAWFYTGADKVKKNLNISTSFYDTPLLAMDDAGLYSCEITTGCGLKEFKQTLNVLKNVTVTKDASAVLDICEGGQTSLGINVTGDYTSIKWYKNDKELGEEVNKKTIPTGELETSGKFIYKYIVEGSCGDVEGTFEVVVHDKPSITVIDINSCEGDIPLSMTVDGTDYIQASWLKPDNTLLAKGTDVTITGASFLNSQGNYTAKVSTYFCGDITTIANVSIHKPIKVLTNSELKPTPCVGNPLSLSVTGEGDGLSYQWYKGTDLLSGKTSTVLDLGTADITDDGNYRCELVSGNNCGNVDVDFVVAVRKDAAITKQPTAKTPCESDASVTFTVAGTGEGTLAYKWFDNDEEISDGADFSGATTTDLTVSNLLNYDNHSFYAKISGESCKSAVSNTVSLNVIKNISIITHPTDQSINENETATFSVVATGGGTITYQWFVNTGVGFTSMGNMPASAQLKTLILTDVPLSSNGYEYYCKVANSCDVKDSDPATLTVSGDNRITSTIKNAKTCEANSFTLTVEYNDTTDGCTWEYDSGSGYSDASGLGSVVNEPESSTLTVTTATLAMNSWKFRARVKRDDFGDNLSNSATVTVYEQVVFTDIADAILCIGAGNNFNVDITAGTGPYTYEWTRVTSGNVLGSLSNLSLTNSEAVSEAYNVKVSNSVCPDVEDQFNITRYPDLVLPVLTNDSPLCIGEEIDLSAIPTSGPVLPVTYAWTQNGTSIGSSSTYNKTNVTTGERGIYKVSVKNSCTTKTASISISVLDAITLAAVSSTNSDVCEGVPFDLQVQGAGDNLVYNWYKIDALGGAIVGTSLSIDKDYHVDGLTTIGSNYYRCILSSTPDCTNPELDFTVNVQENVAVSDPDPITICEDGFTSSFSVTASGETPYTYQWYNNAGEMSGETGSSVSVNNELVNNGQNYYCIVDGACKTAESNKALFTVNENVTITTQPVGITVSDETTTPISFSVNAIGTNLSYQWFENGATMDNSPASAQTKTLTLPAPGLGDDGNTYYCVVSGDCIDETSNTVTLIVNATIKITSEPQNTQICEGSSFNFEVEFKDIVTACDWEYNDGSGYQSISANADIKMATFTAGDVSNVLTIDPSTYSMNGWKFRALINGTEYSSPATVTVYKQVVFTDIADATICLGAGHNFNVNVTDGTGPYTYEWTRVTSGDVLGLSSSLSLTDSEAISEAYKVKVSNSVCPAVEDQFNITRHPDLVLPVLTNDSPLCIGEEIDLSGVPTSGPVLPVTYAWTQNGNSIGSSSTYNKTNVTSSESGIYKVSVKDYCTTKTASITIDVLDAITLTAVSLTNPDVCEGEPFDLQVQGTGDNLVYNWYKLDGPSGSIDGASLSTDKDYHIDGLTTIGANYYRCVLSSTPNCTSPELDFTVNVLENVAVGDPIPITICEDGSTSTFSVTASGETPYTYQWYNNTGEMSGETGSSISVNNVLANNGQNYYCIVTGACKTAESNKALFTVNENVTITTQPVSASVSDVTIDPVYFSVNARGTGLTYQWYKNTASLDTYATADTKTLTVPSSDFVSGDVYYCKITGTCSTVDSDPATLTVSVTDKITSQPTNTEICEKNPFTFEMKYKIAAMGVWWYDDDNDDVYDLVPASIGTASVTDDGTYKTNVLTVEDADLVMNDWKFKLIIDGGPEASSVAKVTVYQKVKFDDISDETLCLGTGASFNVNVTEGTSPYTYDWERTSSVDDKTFVANSNLNLDAASAIDGTYSVSVTNALCPTLTKSFNISHHPDLVLPVLTNDSPLCIGEEIDLSAIPTSGPGLPLTYAWTQNGTSLGSNAATYNKTNVTTGETGIYEVAVANKCTTKRTSISIDVLDAISLAAVSSTSPDVCEGEPFDLQVQGTGDNLVYNWFKLDGPSGSIVEPSLFIGKDYHIDGLTTIGANYYRCVLSSTPDCTQPELDFTVNVQENVAVSDPDPITICEDAFTSSFSVTASGEEPYTYQWYNNAGEMSSETGSSVSVNNELANNGQNYYCIVTGACKSAESDKALFTVNENVTITTQPVGITVSDETTLPITFSVNATGTNLSYQWFENGVSMVNSPASAQTKTLTLPAPGLGDDGNTYYCVVSGECIDETSNTVTLTVNATIKITSQPQNTQICEGSPFNFEVEFKDVVTACDWEFDDGISGYQSISANAYITMATFTAGDVSNVLTINPSTFSMNGWKFRALINGTEYSSAATVTVYKQVVFTPIADAIVCIGAGASFNVNVTDGTGPYTYEWTRVTSGTVLGSSSSLSLSDSDAVSEEYNVRVSNSVCDDVDKKFNINRHPDLVLPVLTNDSPLCIGEEIDLSAIPTSGPGLPLTYAWTQNGTSIGSNAATYNKTNVTTGETGIYEVAVANKCTTKRASISIDVSYAISLTAVSSPSQDVCEGEPFDLQVQGTGDNLVYNWYKIDALGGSIVGTSLSTDKDYHIDGLTTIGANYYRCVLSSTPDCNRPELDFTVNVQENVAVSDPDPITICEDAFTSSFSVIASGETPYTYQWYNNAGEMSGETGSSVSVDNVLTNNGQNYYCIVGGTCKSAESNKALFTVNENVTITSHPVDRIINEMGSATFTVDATGTGLTYQWYVDENDDSIFEEITGETSNTLSLTSVTLDKNGNTYYCKVTGTCTVEDSDPATLTVIKENRILVQAENKVVCKEDVFTFRVDYKDISDDCEWEYDDNNDGNYTPITDGVNTQSTYSILTLTATDVMNAWKFRARVKRNGYSDNLSNEVSVVVDIPATFDPIADVQICNGTGANFSVSNLSGSTPNTYTWSEGTRNLGSNSSLNLDADDAIDGTYTVGVTAGVCPAVPKTFNITHYSDLVLLDLDHENTLCPTGDIKLNVVIDKGPAESASYSWTKDDVDLEIITDSYNKTDITDLESGLYKVTVEDKCMIQSKSIQIDVLDIITKVSPEWVDQSLCAGDALLFEANVSGDSPTYKWTVPSGVADPGNVSTLNISEVTEANEGLYECSVKGDCGDPVVYSANVVVDHAPNITTDLNLSAVCVGEELILGPIAYDATNGESIVWKFNDALSGGTTTSLDLGTADLDPSEEGNYRVEVSNACGTDYSIGYQDIYPLPTLELIDDQIACQGENVVFRAVTTGEALTYSWFYDDDPMPEFDDKSEFVISNIQPKDVYTPWNHKVECRVNSCGEDLNTIAHVLVNPKTILNTSIKDEVVYVGSNHTFAFEVTGSNLEFEWHHINTLGDDKIIEDALSETLEITNLDMDDAGEYYCNITGDCGNRFTSGYLTVKRPLKVITGLSSKDIEKCQGDPLNLNISVEGEVFSIHWFKGTHDLGYDKLNYSISSLVFADAGSYSCVIVGEGLTVTETVNVFVSQNTVLNSALKDKTLCEGEDLSWIPNVSGANLTYTWQNEEGKISTSTSTGKLLIGDVQLDAAGLYIVDVTGKCGDVRTQANLTVKSLPQFISNSPDLDKCENDEEAIFTVTFTGDDLVYQWQKGGVDIKDANSTELKIQNLAVDDAGDYTCIASSSCGVAFSPVMKLMVTPQLTILSESPGMEICAGEDAQFEIEVDGHDVVYQWQKDGVNINTGDNVTGINTSQLAINPADSKREGYYSCAVTDKCTSTERYSNSKKLTIHPLPSSQITGRMVLCVLEDRVAYSTILQPDINYGWLVNGGEFTTPAEGLRTKITWGNGDEDGNLSLTMTNEATGCSFKLDSAVTLRPLPILSLDDFKTYGICEDEFDLQGGSSASDASIGKGIYWVDGIAQNTFDPGQGNGEYHVRYSYTDEYGCSNTTGEKVLTVDSLPIVNIVDDVSVGTCQSKQLSATTDEDNIKWSPSLYLDDRNSMTPTFTAGESTLYVATVVDKHGCSGNDIINVTVAPLPTITTINDTIIGECKEIELTTIISGDIDEITWTNASDLDEPDNSNPMLINRHVGETDYQINVTDMYGCEASGSVQVTVLPNPEIGEDKNLCEGDTLIVDTKDLSNPLWSDGYTAWKRSIVKPGEYVLSVEQNDCKLSQKFVMNPSPVFELDNTVQPGIVIFEGQTVTLDPNLDPDYSPYVYDWSDGSILSQLVVSESGVYKLKVEDNLGCVATDSVEVLVKPIGIESPNAFTPLSDNDNDRFYLKDINVTDDFEMYIYNRWGELLYKTDNTGYAGGWDGTYKGKDCPVGTYVWIIFLDGKEKGKGTVTLLR